MTGEFLRQLDTAILSGLSSSKVARLVGVNEVTVRRRKAALGKAGLLHARAQRNVREDQNAIFNR